MKKNYFTYKDYIGNVNYSAEDEVFYGVIQGIDDLVTFEGDNVQELKNAFEESVDEYLEFCQEIGKPPQKSYRGSFNVRISPDLHKKAAREASIRKITLNEFVKEAIAKAVQ